MNTYLNSESIINASVGKSKLGEDVFEHLKSEINDIKNSIFDSIYPIGAIYISTNNVDPAQLFGIGEWEQIKDTFLLAAGDTYSAGSTGGEAKHKLTAKELPQLGGTISTHGVYAGTPIAAVSGVFSASHTCSGKYMSGSASGHDSIDTITYSNGGQGAAHNNMPPYITVYMWKRIS